MEKISAEEVQAIRARAALISGDSELGAQVAADVTRLLDVYITNAGAETHNTTTVPAEGARVTTTVALADGNVRTFPGSTQIYGSTPYRAAKAMVRAVAEEAAEWIGDLQFPGPTRPPRT